MADLTSKSSSQLDVGRLATALKNAWESCKGKNCISVLKDALDAYKGKPSIEKWLSNLPPVSGERINFESAMTACGINPTDHRSSIPDTELSAQAECMKREGFIFFGSVPTERTAANKSGERTSK